MADRDFSGSTLGEFVLLEKIGEGGYGAVYRAAQPTLKRHVAVKVLRKNDDSAQERFLREAQLASQFAHPFAAPIYAFGVDKDVRWIAMELVQGITLSAWIAQHGPMPLEQFVPVFERISDAVQAAHEQGIVHRDLKPSNIMVLQGGSYWLPKIIDFGIAKSLEQPSEDPPAERDDEAPHSRAATTVRLRPRPNQYIGQRPAPAGVGSAGSLAPAPPLALGRTCPPSNAATPKPSARRAMCTRSASLPTNS